MARLFKVFVFPHRQAMLLSRDGQYLLTGGDGGVISVLRVHDLKLLFAYPGCDAGIRSMAMSHDQRSEKLQPLHQNTPGLHGCPTDFIGWLMISSFIFFTHMITL